MALRIIGAVAVTAVVTAVSVLTKEPIGVPGYLIMAGFAAAGVVIR